MGCCVFAQSGRRRSDRPLVQHPHIAKERDDQGIEQIGSFPLQEVPGAGQHDRPGPIGERHLAQVHKFRADDQIRFVPG